MNSLVISCLCTFAATALVGCLVYLIINRKRKGINSEGGFNAPSFVIKLYNLDLRKINYKRIMWTTSIINIFIIAFTTAVVINIKGLVWEFLVGFLILMILTVISYYILGKVYISKGYSKDKTERSEK